MAQKVITVILGLIIVGGLAWYFNKTYLQPSADNGPSLDNFTLPEGSNNDQTSQLVYVNSSAVKEIWSIDIEKKEKKLFTDADEVQKITKVSNLAPLSREVMAITASSQSSLSGKLISIDLDSAKTKTLQDSFSIPDSWSISADGKEIVFVRFSNVEEAYGYTLYSQASTGDNLRQLLDSASAMKNPVFNRSSNKIAFSKISGTKTELNILDLVTGEESTLASFDGKIVDSLSWSENDSLIFDLRKVDDTSQGEVDFVNTSDKNVKKIVDFSGGIANFIYSNGAWLGYLIAQYEEKPNDSTSGQIYLYNTSTKEQIPVQKGVQVLGWLP